ncbi:hypothetical protein HQ309_00310 [Rhodococcus sp. BP-283]|uniref:hypothetical protein n=2 Tax=Rhodococcus TaxID=1827 RepID=UPI001C9AA3D7|nr:hypothetical protein [Rhodococcus sp. BP-142]MBY6700954.1 hypothetical protein [Rhodococcus sp. BP-283]
MTLLAWRATTGLELQGTTLSDRIDAAVEVDGGDRFLLTEIRALDESLDLIEFTDQLMDASFGPADALARLEIGRLGRDRGVRDLSEDGIEAIRAIVDAAVAHRGGDKVRLLGKGDPSLALALCAMDGTLTTDGDEVGRAVRRRAAIRGIDVDDDRRAPAVCVASVLGLEEAPALDLLDEVVLDLSDGEIAVIVGSSRVLADGLRGAAREKRAGTIKVGTLVAALRLPRGLWREAHRQNVAVWVCRGGSKPKRVHLGDIDRMSDSDLGDLTADVAAALTETAHRSYRFTRHVSAADIVVSSVVVPRGISAVVERGVNANDQIDRVHRATLRTSVAQEALDVLVVPSRAGFVMNRRSLGEMEERKELRVLPRSRIDPGAAHPTGTVAVLPDWEIAFDPIDAERLYPRAERTEVGDVVFTETPAPRAWVDEMGGALVASPARILRLGPGAAVGPRLVAGVINAMAAQGSEWRSWRIPIPDVREAGRLEAALTEIARYEAALRERATAARDLGAALIEGVATGALSIESPDS